MTNHKGRGSTPPGPTIAVVIPVRNGARLAADCLQPIAGQLGSHDELIVVDDASTDGVDEVGRSFGATLIRRAAPAGPYVARNDGWQVASADVILFTDIRCRPEPGWLPDVRQAFAPQDTDLYFSDVVVRDGTSLAARAAAGRQHLLVRHYVTRPYFLPYFPSANLAVSREALAAVGGFGETISGGDADLCWRLQLAGFDRVKIGSTCHMEWVPRTGVREYLQQWNKYGQSNAALRHRFREQGAEQTPPLHPHQIARRSLRKVRRRRSEGWSFDVGASRRRSGRGPRAWVRAITQTPGPPGATHVTTSRSVCYLVLCHRDPDQVVRLVRTILRSSPDASVVIRHDRGPGFVDAAALPHRARQLLSNIKHLLGRLVDGGRHRGSAGQHPRRRGPRLGGYRVRSGLPGTFAGRMGGQHAQRVRRGPAGRTVVPPPQLADERRRRHRVAV